MTFFSKQTTSGFSISLPPLKILEAIAARFSPFEKAVFFVAGLILFGSTLTLLLALHNTFLVEVPARGGTITEGVVGLPRFVNPLLALSDTDRDLVALTYSGLMKATPTGELIPDLAENYTVSPDGLVYTFTIKEAAVFHDGTPVTADDVLFTILKAQDPVLQSPKRANWDGVLVTKTDERTVTFTLKQAYAPFMINTTLGILPEHIWKNISSDEFPFSQFNQKPVGSGPYRVTTIEQTASGVPERYVLRPFERAVLGAPYIERVVLNFYQNSAELRSAYRRGDIESVGSMTPEDLVIILEDTRGVALRAPLQRLFAVFFNQNQKELFADASVREALNVALDKEGLVRDVLFGFGSPISGPLPIERWPHENTESETKTLTREDRLISAKEILEAGGWEYSLENRVWEKTVGKETRVLSFALSTGNAPELKAAAQAIRASWEALGVPVDVQYFEATDLQQSIIRPRKYETLLFGMIVGRELDLFAFWHSSQRNDPGLNVAMYTNSTADSLLEKARETADAGERETLLRDFSTEVMDDHAAVFVYAPDFVYVVPEKLKGITLRSVVTPSDRFLNIQHWYLQTEYVWSIFAPADE